MVTDDENSAELEETTSFDGESSSCFFSEEEIDNCLDSPHIEYNFTDLKKIGAGGFGSVYEAVHTIEDKKYALKFVKIFSLDFDKREVKILASLNHPNVLRYYTSWITPFHKWSSCSEGSGKENSDSIVSFEKEIPPSEKNNAVVSTDSKSKNSKSSEFIYDACLVIQTELCNPNKNLEILIHEGEIFTMSDKKRLNLFLDIVSGLEYMHSKGIMHRDLKPSNILLDIDNRAKIGDFGFARKCKLSPAGKTSENEFSQNVGTCLYVAPEVRDSNIYDKNADIYSLGMILFEMYHKMGSRMERIKIMEKLRNQEFSDLKNIPAQFRNVRILVKSLLSHDPQLRKTLKRIIKLMSPSEQQRRSRRITYAQSRPRALRTNKPPDGAHETIHWQRLNYRSMWQRLAPLQANHCPYSTEDNVCFELIKSSTNCSYICAYAQPLVLYPALYDLCGYNDRVFSGYAECHFYECQKKCCKGWSMDEFGKCSIERSGIDCLNGGTSLGDLCLCTKHFTGKNCERAVCDGECLNGGECRKVDPYLPPKCVCTANFTGNYCEKPVCGEGCLNGGTCLSNYYGVVCACPEGYLGPRCEQEFTPKLDSCRIVHSSYDTNCASTCKSDRDCTKEESCCDHEGRNICVVRQEKAYQTCEYDGFIPKSRLRVGQVVKDAWGKTCRCMPGYVDGIVHCGDDECGTFDPEENTCKSHGDGVMYDDDHVKDEDIDGDIEYHPPRMINCPPKYTRVLVEVQQHSNVGLLYHKFHARDYLGEELNVYVSQQKFFACNCSFGQRVRANATAVDRHGGKSTCCFTVQIVDHHPPKLSHCPTDIYAVVGERISWTVPKATDNVGIRDLWLEPRVSDGSRIGPGDHMFRYVAEDWHGNKAECRFLVSVKISGSPESGWPTELKSRIQTDTSVIIGACVVGILAIALLVLMVVVFRVCRRARVFERRQLRSFRSSLPQTATNQIDASLSEPPPYEVAAKDKLPDYKPRDDPPVYDDICKEDSRTDEIGGCSNPIYTISGSDERIYRAPVNPNTTVTDV